MGSTLRKMQLIGAHRCRDKGFKGFSANLHALGTLQSYLLGLMSFAPSCVLGFAALRPLALASLPRRRCGLRSPSPPLRLYRTLLRVSTAPPPFWTLSLAGGMVQARWALCPTREVLPGPGGSIPRVAALSGPRPFPTPTGHRATSGTR